MTHFEYIAVAVSIILGLGVIQLLSNLDRVLALPILAALRMGFNAVLDTGTELVGVLGSERCCVESGIFFALGYLCLHSLFDGSGPNQDKFG